MATAVDKSISCLPSSHGGYLVILVGFSSLSTGDGNDKYVKEDGLGVQQYRVDDGGGQRRYQVMNVDEHLQAGVG